MSKDIRHEKIKLFYAQADEWYSGSGLRSKQTTPTEILSKLENVIQDFLNELPTDAEVISLTVDQQSRPPHNIGGNRINGFRVISTLRWIEWESIPDWDEDLND